MLFDAHNHAFRVFGGNPGRGIYDNIHTAIDRVGRGKERDVNVRFLAMVTRYLLEPEFCNPTSGWEKGQENQTFAANSEGSSNACFSTDCASALLVTASHRSVGGLIGPGRIRLERDRLTKFPRDDIDDFEPKSEGNANSFCFNLNALAEFLKRGRYQQPEK